MTLRKVAAFTASVMMASAMAAAISLPARAQGGRHNRAGLHHYARTVRHNGFYHSQRRPALAAWHPGPGYVHHTWAWYHNHPAAWRAAHPYHGSPTLGIWIHI